MGFNSPPQMSPQEDTPELPGPYIEEAERAKESEESGKPTEAEIASVAKMFYLGEDPFPEDFLRAEKKLDVNYKADGADFRDSTEFDALGETYEKVMRAMSNGKSLRERLGD